MRIIGSLIGMVGVLIAIVGFLVFFGFALWFIMSIIVGLFSISV